MNQFAQFMESLFQSGQLVLSHPVPLTQSEINAGLEVAEEFEIVYRKQLPHQPPAIDKEAVAWSAVSFYRASQYIVYREIESENVVSSFEILNQSANLDRTSPSVHYSIDLVFRFVPDLLTFGNSANLQDPTCNEIRRWARDWPLSSVGIKTDDSLIDGQTPPQYELDISGFASHKCLMQLYVDRILRTGDKSRLDHPDVIKKLKQTVGIHSQLAGTLLD